MPVLKNPKREAFAQAIAAGSNATAAHRAAGFAGNRKSASKLRHQGDIGRRVAEIVSAKSTVVQKAEERAVERLVEAGSLSVEYILQGLIDNVEVCLGRKTISKKVYSKTDETVHQVDVTMHEPAAATAALTMLGKHLGMFTEKLAVEVKEVKPDYTDPQVKLKLARNILFMIATAEHEVRNAPKTIEHKPSDKEPLT